ncbi:MAG TPA: DUF4349 domain-containing protein [Flavobacterium sp.]|nr:DUF4349 domain-containing protein [Flavobacterium sp.]
MKTIPKAGLAVFVIALAFSCKQAQTPQEESVATEEVAAESKATASDSVSTIISSNAAVADKDPKRKFVRTADIKFKVKNVAKSTYAIENTVTKFGGIVTNTNLQSHIDGKHSTIVSQDSTLETTKYTVENNITIRIPNTRLDTVIKTIRCEVDFLDYRVIKADDVALKMLSNQLAQSRTTNHTKRLENDIDRKGKKLIDINDAENNILDKQEQKDNAAIENLSLRDQVNFSTITLALYQNESVKQELVAIEKNPESYGNFGLEILDGLKTGWFILERIIAYVVQFWSLFLLAFLGIFIYRKLRKQKPLTIDN